MFFLSKVLLLKAQHLHTKLTFQKPMLRQIERGVPNGPITKTADLPQSTYFLKVACRVRVTYLKQ